MDFDYIHAIESALEKKTDKERQEELEAQIAGRQRMNVPTVAESKVIQGERIEEIAKRNIAVDPTDDAYNQLAYGMFLQGKLEQAIATVKDDSKRRAYMAVLNAVNGAAKCNCAEKNPKTQTSFLSDQIWVRGKITNLYTCIVCGLIQCLDH